MISWFEIPATNLKRAKAFYEALMDVAMVDVEMGGDIKMAVFPGDEKSVSGGIMEYEGFYTPSHDGPLIYLNCNPDLQTCQDKVENLGGKVLMPKKQISKEHGYMAVIEDTEGNRVALYSMG